MIKLSEQKGKGFKKSIGYEHKNDGKKQKMWWLGKERQKAEILALRIQSEWQQIKSAGGSVWTEETVQELMKLKSALYSEPTPTLTLSHHISAHPQSIISKSQIELPQSTTEAPLTYYQAIDYYCNDVIPEMNVSHQWKRDLKGRMLHIKDALADLTLVEINTGQLTAIVNYYKSRPENKKYKRPISIDFAKTQIRTTKRLFEWLYDQGWWVICKGFNKSFKISPTDFKFTNKEKIKAIKGKPIFSVDELAILYSMANPTVKEYMVLSLNCGFTQSEIDRLLVGECKLEDDNPHIIKLRDKTGNVVIGKWSLWQETIEILKKHIDRKYSWDYKKDDEGIIWYKHINNDKWKVHDCQYKGAFKDLMADKIKYESKIIRDIDYVYSGGLVYLNDDDVKIDAIASAWWRLLQKCPKISQYSFKSLRKTGADMIKKISSEETSIVYLSHSPKTVAGMHYVDANYDKLSAALSIFRENLQPMFDAGE